ncbi:hypothetical protein [Spirosoma telluris]|uniref:hypothetical protein n=1 Tax=Spirosoma telluris TaxID=2183553 RepID=UPI002FC31743
MGRYSGRTIAQWIESRWHESQFAAGYVEMNAAIHNGTLFDDYYRNKPVLGNVKLEAFAEEFAIVYNAS